jgi:UDP-N-acetylglucosamine 2-epimerase
MHSLCTLSDSGTISEESSILNFPAISLRQSMERPEAQDTGSIILTGFDPDVILNSISLSIKEKKERKQLSIPQDYMIEDTSWRVVKLISGNCKLSNMWNGID